MLVTDTVLEDISARPVSLADLPVLVALCNSTTQHLYGADMIGEERLKSVLSHPTIDMGRDTVLVLSPGGDPAGWAYVENRHPPYVVVGIKTFIEPEHHTAELEDALLHWGIQRGRELATRAPADARVSAGVFASADDTLKQERVFAAGFRKVRHFFRMAITLDEPVAVPPLRAELRIATMAPDLRRAAFYACWEAFEDHWGAAASTFEEELPTYERWLATETRYDPGLFFHAVEGEQVAGLVWCIAPMDEDSSAAYIDTVAVRPAWRRQGIARGLLLHAFEQIRQRGYSRAMLDVDATSLTGATDLYTKAGMVIIRQADLFEMELRPGEDLLNRG